MILLQALGLTRSFGLTGSLLPVLKGIDIQLAAGEMVAIMGASGSGKTTLLQILGTLDRPTSGSLLFRGDSLLDKNNGELAKFRNHEIGFIFQFHHLLPDFSALENVMMPALISGMNKTEARPRAEALLTRVELDHRFHHRVGELSGGEQQRAALARALVMEPELLLADEPTGNLDSRSGTIVFELLRALSAERGLATIMVTHNSELASQMDRCLSLRDGVLET